MSNLESVGLRTKDILGVDVLEYVQTFGIPEMVA